MAASQPDFAGRSPWTRPGFIAAAAVVAFIVLGAVAVTLLPDDDGTSSARPTGVPPATDAATAPAAETPGAGGPGAGSVPTTAPEGVEWRLLGQVAVPYSATAGPRNATATTASGYAHTPTGALIAAVQLAARAALSTGRQVWEPTITGQFVPSPDRDKLLELLRAAPQAQDEPGELSQVAGFQFLSYTPDAAVIGLAFRTPGSAGTYHILTATLSWRDNDWRMHAPPAGTWTSINRATTDLTGVVAWGAR